MKKLIVLTGAAIIFASIIYTFIASDDPESYKSEILELREDQDRFMRYSGDSPFVQNEVPFDSLQYFPPDPAFRIVGEFREAENANIVELGTNDGQTEQYLTYGYAQFTLHDKPQQLLILEDVSEERLFIPFGDETSALETYGAGRYLDIEHHGSRTIVLDFNRAYNPYCAYVDGFTCPLPPVENLLTVAISAGEKTYH